MYMKRCFAAALCVVIFVSCGRSESSSQLVSEDYESKTQSYTESVGDTIDLSGEVAFFDGDVLTITSESESCSLNIPDEYYEDNYKKLFDIGVVNNPFGIKTTVKIKCTDNKSALSELDVITPNGEFFEGYVMIKSIANNIAVIEYNGEMLTAYLAVKDIYSVNYTKEALRNKYSVSGMRFADSDKLVLTQLIPYAGIVNGFETYSAQVFADKLYGGVVDSIDGDRITVRRNSDNKQVSVTPAIYEGELSKGESILLTRLSKGENDKNDEICEEDICGIEKINDITGELLYLSEYQNDFTVTLQQGDKQIKLKADSYYDKNGNILDKSQIKSNTNICVRADDVIVVALLNDKVYYAKNVYIE